jgi:tRNA A-37 threonylcarbamoyl transferase component Bud32
MLLLLFSANFEPLLLKVLYKHMINETVASIKNVFEAAVRSLARIHAAGVSHGDISPSNIIYSTEWRTAVFIDLESVL